LVLRASFTHNWHTVIISCYGGLTGAERKDSQISFAAMGRKDFVANSYISLVLKERTFLIMKGHA
jgi:hypothetical protein